MIRVCPTCQQKYPEDTEFCAQDGTRLEEMQNDSSDPLIGRVLDGRWVIEDRIGEGGMGAVYLASQRSVDRRVAIKTLRPELCNSREFVDRFFREARVASTIAHPHCVTILDFGQTDDGTLYLAMEYLEGMPLTHRLHHPDLSVREIIQICIQISSALAAAHENKVIHRDLKPDNVFLLSISDGSTFTKVLDFGIAKVTDSEEKMTQTGQVFGTPEYMSPEQCRGDKLDGRSDLYSLGCILYRMLSGRPPFQSDTPMAVLVSHVSERPRHVRELIERDDVPQELSDLCMQLLSKNVDNRPPDAQAVRAVLEEIAGHTTSGSSKVVSAAAPATSDDHVSGKTLSTQQAGLVHDGGAPVPNPSAEKTDGGQQAQGSPHEQPEDQTPASTQPPAAQRTDTSFQNTTSSSPVGSTPKKKSLLPLIMGVGLAVVLAAGCAVGALYVGYTQFFAEEGESFSVATFFGEESGQTAGEQADDEASAVEVDDQKQADSRAPGAGGDDEPADTVAANDQADEAKTADDTDSATDKGGRAAGADGETGGETDDQQGAKQMPGGSSSGDDDKRDDQARKSASSDSKNDDDSTVREVTINADKANIAVNADSDDSGKADSTRSGSKVATKAQPRNDRENDNKKSAKAKGNIREAKLSTSGNACIDPNVESVLSSAESRFLSCYSSHLGSNAGASGKVMLAWNISTDGSILTPEVLISDLKAIDGCMLGKLKQLRFDPPDGGRCYVRATYRFYP